MMKGRAAWVSLAAITAVIGIFLLGCATGPSSGPAASKSQDDLLRQAGFVTQSANSPQRLAYIKTLPAKKVVLNQYQEKPIYLVCTDSEAKQCFLGDQAAYERYQKLAIQQSLSEDLRTVQEHRWDPQALQMWVNSQGGG
jgi:hypothetical protein